MSKEKLEDTKWVIIRHKLKDRQYYDQKKGGEKTNNDRQNTTQKTID